MLERSSRKQQKADAARSAGRSQYGKVSASTRHGRNHPAPASGAGKSGRRQVFRRAGAGAEGFHAHRPRWPGHGQHPGGGQADAEPAALRDLPAVDAVGAVRGVAGGRRSAETEARVLLRRGASVVQRCAKAADGQDRAGGAADPLKGRRGLFRDTKSDRRSGQGARPIGQPRAACAESLHAARPESGCGGGADVPAQSEARHRQGHHGIGQGRGAGVVPGRQRHARDGRARHDPAAVGADRADHAGGTQGDHGQQPGEGQIRHRDRFRIRL